MIIFEWLNKGCKSDKIKIAVFCLLSRVHVLTNQRGKNNEFNPKSIWNT